MNILKGKRKIWLMIALIAIAFVIPQLGLADIGQAVAQIISSAVLNVVNFLVGWLITLLVKVFVAVAQYNQFIASAAVSKGWIIIRDVFNMFFVIALLIIAFSTVLGIQKYHYKRILLSLLIAAVLVNFSKLICGIFIDISQVLMLTFVGAFKDVAGGNLIEMMGLRGLLSLKSGAGQDVGGAEIMGATLLALIMAVVSVVVLGVIVMILIFRIVWLWFLVVLSPLAFVSTVLPSTERYGRRWWSQFGKEIVVGPVLAFCLWLSFAVVQQGDIAKGVEFEEKQAGANQSTSTDQKISEAASPQYILNFMLGIGMLVGSLMVAETLGVAGAGLATKAKGKLEAYAKGEKGPLKGAKEGAKRVGRAAKGVAKGAGKAAVKTPGKLVQGGLKSVGRKMQKKGGRMEKVGKAVEVGAEPVKNIQQLKANIGGYFDKKGKKRNERMKKREEIRKSDKYDTKEERKKALKNVEGSSIVDEAMFNLSETYKSTGFSDRQAISAAQTKNIQETMDRWEKQGKTDDEIELLLDRGSKTESQAAALMLAKRGKIDNPNLLKKTSKSLSGLPELSKKFNKHAKKQIDPDILAKGFYNGFKRGMDDFKDVMDDIKSGDLDPAKFFKELSDDNFNKMEEASEGQLLTNLSEMLDGDDYKNTISKLNRSTKGKKRYNKMLKSVDTSEMESKKEKDKFIKANSDQIMEMDQTNFDKMQELAGEENLLSKVYDSKDNEDFESWGNKMRNTKKGRQYLNSLIDGNDKIEGMDSSKLESEEDKQTFVRTTGRLDFVLESIKNQSDIIEEKYKQQEQEIKESDKYETEEERKNALKDNQKAKKAEMKKKVGVDEFISDNKGIIMNNLSEKAAKNKETVKTLLENKAIKRKDIDNLEGKNKKAFLNTLEEDLLSELNAKGDTSDFANKARKIYAKIKNNISQAFEGATDQVQNQLGTMIDNNDIKIEDIAKNKLKNVDTKTIETLGNKLSGKQVIEIAKNNNFALAKEIYKIRKAKGNLSDAEKDSEWFDTDMNGKSSKKSSDVSDGSWGV